MASQSRVRGARRAVCALGLALIGLVACQPSQPPGPPPGPSCAQQLVGGAWRSGFFQPGPAILTMPTLPTVRQTFDGQRRVITSALGTSTEMYMVGNDMGTSCVLYLTAPNGANRTARVQFQDNTHVSIESSAGGLDGPTGALGWQRVPAGM